MSTINSIGLFGMITTLLIGFICLITFNWDMIWIILLLFVIFIIMASYESEEEIAEKKRIRDNETKNQSKKYGASEYIVGCTLSEQVDIDTQHKLFRYEDEHYNVQVLPISKIQSCSLTEHIVYENKSFSQGLKDGAFSAVTGVGVIRDSSTLKKGYKTGKVVMHIKFINQEHLLKEIEMVLEDVDRAIKIKNWIANNS